MTQSTTPPVRASPCARNLAQSAFISIKNLSVLEIEEPAWTTYYTTKEKHCSVATRYDSCFSATSLDFLVSVNRRFLAPKTSALSTI